jgi:hypothetical protein
VEVVAVELAYLVLVVHRDQPGPRVTQVLPDLRATLANVDLPVQKDHVAFRVHLDLLAVELEEPRSLVLKDREALLALLDQRGITVFQALLVPPEQMVNQDPRVRTVRSVLLALLDRRVLPDLQESVAPPVRMQSPLSSTSISPRMRRPRPMARRLMSKTHSDRPIRSRMVLGITLR